MSFLFWLYSYPHAFVALIGASARPAGPFDGKKVLTSLCAFPGFLAHEVWPAARHIWFFVLLTLQRGESFRTLTIQIR